MFNYRALKGVALFPHSVYISQRDHTVKPTKSDAL